MRQDSHNLHWECEKLCKGIVYTPEEQPAYHACFGACEDTEMTCNIAALRTRYNCYIDMRCFHQIVPLYPS